MRVTNKESFTRAKGGFFKARPWLEPDGRECAWSCVWGTLTTHPQKVIISGIPKVTFNLRYHTGTYIKCEAWGDTAVETLASSLRRQDVVFCIGEYFTKPRPPKTRRGRQTDRYGFRCDMIVSMNDLGKLCKLLTHPAIIKCLNWVDNAPPDAFESVTKNHTQKENKKEAEKNEP